MFKRIVCIITVVSILASALCLSAFASPVESGDAFVSSTFYKNNVMFEDIGLDPAFGDWSMYDWDIGGVKQCQTGLANWGTIASIAGPILNKFTSIYGSLMLTLSQYMGDYNFKDEMEFRSKFLYSNDVFLGSNSAFFIGMASATSVTHSGSLKLHVFSTADGRHDIRTTWYDGSKVDYKSLQACCTFLQNQGFMCQIVRLPYTYVLGNDTYKYGEGHFIAFYGKNSGGWVIEDDYGDIGCDWYLLCDEWGGYIGCKYSEFVQGDDPKVNQPFSPDSTLETDGRDYLVPETNTTIDIPLTFWDEDNLYYYDFTTNTSIPIGAYLYNPSLYKYQFYNVDNSTTVNITYNIDYTQVTYIGSSEEYEAYELYYKLPDGRSSADMTAEDLEQLNLNYDVINYGKSTDDGRLRSLYHLDGNTDDSSYWVNQTSFEWVTNPSIEYLEATNFEGCLYLDEQDHAFKLKLPSNLAASDFTILFRYYHYGYGDTENNTATNYTDLVVQSVDSVTQNAYSTLFTNLAGTLTTNSTTPIGQWCEVGIVRDGATLYTYLNGVVIDSKPFIDVLGDTLLFDFKDVAVRRQIDEIRVFNYAQFVNGVSYTPITVPMDTNLVLVLPDEGSLLPDAYWDFNTDGNLLESYDFSSGDSRPFDSWNFTRGSFYYSRENDRYGPIGVPVVALSEGSSTVYSDHVYLAYSNSFDPSQFYIPSPANSDLYLPQFYSSSFLNFRFSLGAMPSYIVPLGYISTYSSGAWANNNPYDIVAGQDYSYSILSASGDRVSATLDNISFGRTDFLFDISESDTCYVGLASIPVSGNNYQQTGNLGNFVFAFVCPKEGGLDLVYQEFKQGEPNDQSDAYKTVIYDDEAIKPNTIAVRSTVPVRTWRIGGVRPTLPYRGDVWIMIQGKRITSVQIYTSTMWTEVDCRIWTGERWAWPNYFDILTQQDMTDINGTTDNVYIQDTDGYYSWITEQWKQLLDLLNSILDGILNIDGGTDINLDFNFDGTVSIEFDTSLEVGRNSMFELLQFFYDSTFKPAVDGLGNGLDTFSVIISPSGGSITVDGQVVESPMGIIGKEYDWEV